MDSNHSHNQVFALFSLFADRFTFCGSVASGFIIDMIMYRSFLYILQECLIVLIGY